MALGFGTSSGLSNLGLSCTRVFGTASAWVRLLQNVHGFHSQGLAGSAPWRLAEPGTLDDPSEAALTSEINSIAEVQAAIVGVCGFVTSHEVRKRFESPQLNPKPLVQACNYLKTNQGYFYSLRFYNVRHMLYIYIYIHIYVHMYVYSSIHI